MLRSPYENRRRVACIRIPRLPIQAELIRRPELSKRPVVITSRDSSGGTGAGSTIAWCSEMGEACGLRPGMPLREALATCRNTVVLPPDPGCYEAIHDTMLEALEEVAPAVESVEMGCAYADITGMERLYPQTSVLLRALAHAAGKAVHPERSRVDRRSGGPSAGAGPNKFVAGVAAQKGASLAVVSSEEAAGFLAPLSVLYLPVSDEMQRRIHLFGLQSMGQIARLSPAAVEAQFGKEGRRAWELAQGIDDENVVARRPFRPITESLVFPAPVSDWTAFWAGLRQLLVQVWQRKERGGATVRQLQFLARMDEETWERTVTLHEPVGDRERLESMIRRRLEGSTLPGAVGGLTLKLTLLGGAYVGQESLFTNGNQRLKKIKEAVAGIKARDGATGLYRITEVEPWSRIPERRYALISFEP